MALFFNSNNGSDNKVKLKVYKYLVVFISLLGTFISLGILFPTAASVVFSFIWVALFVVVVIFLTLGMLVIFGLREEVAEVLDVILEGSLTLLDAIELLKKMWKRFVELLKEFILYAIPTLAYILSLFIYLSLLIFYKSIGKTNDVTVLTVILTFMLVGFANIINRPKKEIDLQPRWLDKITKRFRRAFIDGLEVTLFIFFLTMDSTNLFFLPPTLNNPIEAEIGGYDLMKRGIDFMDHAQTTLTLIIVGVVIELIRNVLKIVAVARKYYFEHSQLNIEISQTAKIKASIRKSFGDAKDDFLRFITFTTVLLIVFLILPRLKLLTLAVASLTALILDIVIRERLTTEITSDDLFSRILIKVFKLES